jgi:hypothetical protein
VLHELNELTFSFGRRIPSARRRFFVRPAHSITAPPFSCSAGASIAGPSSFRSAGASHCCAAFSLSGRRIPSSCHNLFVCRRIRRGSTNLVLFHLAGAFLAEPPPIWHCFTWTAHSPLIWSLRLPAHSPPTQCRSFWPAHPLAVPPSLFLAGASPRHATTPPAAWTLETSVPGRRSMVFRTEDAPSPQRCRRDRQRSSTTRERHRQLIRVPLPHPRC